MRLITTRIARALCRALSRSWTIRISLQEPDPDTTASVLECPGVPVEERRRRDASHRARGRGRRAIAGLSRRGPVLGSGSRAPRPRAAWRIHGLRFSSGRRRAQVDRGEYERGGRLPERVAGSSPARLLRGGRGRADAIREPRLRVRGPAHVSARVDVAEERRGPAPHCDRR